MPEKKIKNFSKIISDQIREKERIRVKNMFMKRTYNRPYIVDRPKILVNNLTRTPYEWTQIESKLVNIGFNFMPGIAMNDPRMRLHLQEQLTKFNSITGLNLAQPQDIIRIPENLLQKAKEAYNEFLFNEKTDISHRGVDSQFLATRQAQLKAVADEREREAERFALEQQKPTTTGNFKPFRGVINNTRHKVNIRNIANKEAKIKSKEHIPANLKSALQKRELKRQGYDVHFSNGEKSALGQHRTQANSVSKTVIDDLLGDDFFDIIDNRQDLMDAGQPTLPVGRQQFPQELYSHNYWQNAWQSQIAGQKKSSRKRGKS